MKLVYYMQGNNNNFNLIRMLAALAVLITHSFAIAIGSSEDHLQFALLGGMSMAAVAVDVFFVISGFLVTTSLLNRRSVIDFFVARALRIVPALFIVLTLSVFAIGPYFTTLTIFSYFSQTTTYIYLLKCSTLFFQIAYELPGVFEANHYPKAVNGSLWSMKYEVRFYAALAGLWLVISLAQKFKFDLFKILVAGLMVILSGAILVHLIIGSQPSVALRLACLFFSGATYSLLKEKVSMSTWVFGMLVFVGVLAGALGKSAFYMLYIFSVPYIILYLAYIPEGVVRKYNAIGDYSYGVYIYAFPVQQSLAAIIPEVMPGEMALLSALITLPLAFVSWHLVEERSLRLKGYFSLKIRKMFGLKTVSVQRVNER